MGRKFGFSFSWKRALGLSSAKGRLSRMIGIPLTRSGRERKLGRIATGGGCALIVGAGFAGPDRTTTLKAPRSGSLS